MSRISWVAFFVLASVLSAVGSAAANPPEAAPFIEVPASLVHPDEVSVGLKSGPRSTTTTFTKSWMGKIEDERLLGEMSIPGTHDSAAIGCGLICSTQYWSLTQQLEAGIRFLDIRFQRVGNSFDLRHGSKSLDGTLADAFEEVTQWLDANPNEAVIMILQQQSADDDAGAFSTIWDQTGVDAYESYFLRSSFIRSNYESLANIPLGDIRGKILLWKRYLGSELRSFGFHRNSDAYKVIWQNAYKITDWGVVKDSVTPKDKGKLIELNLISAVAQGNLLRSLKTLPTVPAGLLHVNFLSGSIAGISVVTSFIPKQKEFAVSPIRKAKAFNKFTYGKLEKHCPDFTKRCTTGIIYTDAPDDKLIYFVVQTNFGS